MKTNVLFKFDKEKDLDNIWRTANKESKFMDFSKHLPKKVIELSKGKSFEECKKSLEKYYLKIHNSKALVFFSKAINQSWKEIETEYFRRLKKVTGKDLRVEEIRGWITLASRCPYNPKNYSFFVSYYSSIPQVLETAGHEILHLHFHKYYWDDIEKKLGYEKTNDLKEALTILLNKEFYDLWHISERGYDCHKELREFISGMWDKNKDFEMLLNKCIAYLKKK